jgi:hypothetical protein
MSTAPPPMPSAQPTEPGLSGAARIMNVFVAPKKTFADLKANPSWWVPWLITSVFGLIFGAVAVQKIDMVQFSRHQIEQSKMAQRQMEQLSPEQQEQNLQIRAKVTKFFFFVTPLFSLLAGLIYAAVLMAVFNFGFAAEIPFKRALAIVFYALLPGLLTVILLTVSLLVSSDPNAIDIAGNPIPTNPGFFMNPETSSKFLYSMISKLDVITIWTVILLGLGFSVNSANRKLSAGTAIGTVLVIYAVLALIGAGFKAAF